jgi:hypothetical protein
MTALVGLDSNLDIPAMTCPHCRCDVTETDKFCHECGTRLIAPTAAEKRRAALQQAGAVAREGGRAAAQGAKLAKKGLETQRGRSVAACAAIGAAAGTVLPVIGTGFGAVVGAAAGFFRKL